MKKRKSLIVTTLLAVVLSVAMLMGTMGISAFAAVNDSSNVTTNGTGPAKFVTKIEYGEPTDAFKGADSVVLPSGTEVKKEQLDEYTPYELGVYTVKYGKYSYVVSCKLTTEYELRVDYNGADIPTYLDTTNGTFVLPEAALWKKDDKSVSGYTRVDSEAVKAKIVGLSDSETYDVAYGTKAEARTVNLTDPGSYTVHYFCNLGGNKGTKYYYKDYTVKVQKNFTDDKAKPQITVVNFPSTLSLNTKVELPKATVTHTYDANVKVLITVEEWNETEQKFEPVKEVTLDEYGYAAGTTDVEAKFDNEYNRSFYPTKAVDYKFTYKAVADNGMESAGVNTATVKASDRTKPRLVEIADDQIPGTWGFETVTKKDGDGTEELTDKAINFPYPEFIDNYDDKLTVSFEIKDSVNNQTVLKFANIYDYDEEGVAGEGAKYTYAANAASKGVYVPAETEGDNGTLTFSKSGFKFDFSKYATQLKESEKTATGTYTVTYQAHDSAPNFNTDAVYEIKFEDNYSDTSEPDVKVTYNDTYLVFTDDETEFTIPAARVSDEDTRLNLTYTLYAKSDASKANAIEVDGGETAILKLEGGKAVLLIEDKFDSEKDKKLTFEEGDKLIYEVVAIDDVGNETTVTNAENPVDIVNGGSLELPSEIKFEEKLDSYELTLGDKTTVGGFTFEAAPEVRPFYGFELSLVGDGKLLTSSNISFTTYYYQNKVHVDDIAIKVPNVDELILFVRVYNVAGLSYTNSIDFTVKGAGSGDGDKTMGSAAANLPVNGSAYTTYLLKNDKGVSIPDDIAEGKEFVVRQIEGTGKFSLTGGSLFTAYNTGSFNFTDGYFRKVEGGDDVFTVLNKKNSGIYDLTVTDTSTTNWEVLGEMPSYAEKDAMVTLPKVVAYSDFANAVIELKVTDPDGTVLKVAPSKEDNAEGKYDVRFNGDQYEFKATKDGTYNVEYIAVGSDGRTTRSFAIKAGDIVAPDFELVGTHETRAVENGKFEFKAVKINSEEDTLNTTVTNSIHYKKTLKAPDGSEVYTVDGYGNSYRDMTKPSGSDAYVFTKVGNYTVEYTVYDKVGNSSVQRYTITVTAAQVSNPVNTKIISTILIIVGVLLIAGVILYFVRFRKVKSK